MMAGLFFEPNTEKDMPLRRLIGRSIHPSIHLLLQILTHSLAGLPNPFLFVSRHTLLPSLPIALLSVSSPLVFALHSLLGHI